ncbi:hypothetical protein EON71_01360, partial [bacterium]
MDIQRTGTKRPKKNENINNYLNNISWLENQTITQANGINSNIIQNINLLKESRRQKVIERHEVYLQLTQQDVNNDTNHINIQLLKEDTTKMVMWYLQKVPNEIISSRDPKILINTWMNNFKTLFEKIDIHKMDPIQIKEIQRPVFFRPALNAQGFLLSKMASNARKNETEEKGDLVNMREIQQNKGSIDSISYSDAVKTFGGDDKNIQIAEKKLEYVLGYNKWFETITDEEILAKYNRTHEKGLFQQILKLEQLIRIQREVDSWKYFKQINITCHTTKITHSDINARCNANNTPPFKYCNFLRDSTTCDWFIDYHNAI